MPENASLRPLVDDRQAIRDSDTILRVIQPGYFQRRDVQSNGFQDQSLEIANRNGLAGPCASVNVRRIWEEHGGDLQALLEDFPTGSGVVEVSVAAARRLKTAGPQALDVAQGFMLDPRTGRPWHAVMFSLTGGQRSKGAKRALVELCQWFWHPDDVRLSSNRPRSHKS